MIGMAVSLLQQDHTKETAMGAAIKKLLDSFGGWPNNSTHSLSANRIALCESKYETNPITHRRYVVHQLGRSS